MKILVTGGSGFIGRHILDQLTPMEHEIFATTTRSKRKLERQFKDLQWCSIDISRPKTYQKLFAQFQPDIVIHLAWRGIPDYSAEICQSNLCDSSRFFHYVAHKTDCRRLIVAGSCMEYQKRDIANEETGLTGAGNFFPWAKTALMDYAFLLGAQTDIDVAWFRIFYVYGNGQRGDALVPTLIESVKNQVPFPINNPDNNNDFIYVKDVARAFALSASRHVPINGVFDLGSGQLREVRDVCRIVEESLIGETVMTQRLQPSGGRTATGSMHLGNRAADIAKTKLQLGWSAEWTLEDGLRDCLIDDEKSMG
jgi:nucleoside-diphosphate-sugar epimerase